MEVSGTRGGLVRWLSAHVVALSVVLGVLLLYTLAGCLLLPRLARQALVSYAHDTLHRELALGAVSFNPFTLTAQLRDCALTEPDHAPIASFALLRVGASWRSLLPGPWVLREVRLEQPHLHLLIARDGSLNLAKLAPPHAAGAPAAAKSLPLVRIGAFSVHQGQVHFEDRSREQPFATTLSPIELALADFRTQPAFQDRYRFSAATNAGEQFAWSGEFSLQPLGSNGDFSVTALRASTIASYLADALPFELRGGSLDLQGQYQFTTTAGLSLRLPSLRLHAVAIGPRAAAAGEGSEPWLTLPELDLTDTVVGLNARQVRITQLALSHPALRVWRAADGTLNLQRLMGAAATPPLAATATLAPASPSAPAPPASPPWHVALARLEVEGAQLAVEDRSVSPVFKLSIAPLNFTAAHYVSDAQAPLDYTLDTGLGGEARLKSSGSVSLPGGAASLDLELSGFDLTSLQPYVAQRAALTLNSGRLTAKAHVAYLGSPAHAQPQLKLTGDIEVAALSTRDEQLKAKFISWDLLQIRGLRYQQAPDALDIAAIRARGAYARVLIGANGSLNVAEVLHPKGVTVAEASTIAPKKLSTLAHSTATSSSMPMHIGRIDFEDSTANFTDRSVQPNFSSAIVGLSGSVVGLSSDPASRARVTLMGSVDRYAPVSIMGSVNLLSAATYTDLTLDFRNIELTTFNPYSGKFAGYAIKQGKLTTEMVYHVEDRKLDAKHHVEIDQLEFGEATASKQAVSLPVKLAVALLKDRNGVISLDFPVSGTLDDPSFRIGPIIWQVFKNLIVKAVTAPFALLGRLFGGGADLSFVDFPAGSAALSPTDTEKLNHLASALVERPQLKLDIPLQVSSPGDDAALARAALEKALADAQQSAAAPAARVPAQRRSKRAATAPPAPPASPRLQALTVLYRQQFQADPVFPPPQLPAAPAAAATAAPAPLDDAARINWLEQQLLAKFAPTQQRRDALARERAQAAEGAVLSNQQVQPERVFLTERTSGGSTPTTARMELKLQ